MIAVGVDTDKHEHLARALDGLGQILGGLTIRANLHGYVELAQWLRTLGEGIVVEIEGAGSYGAGLCEFLLAEGIDVVEVERPRREDRRRGKSDEIDALLAAKKVLAQDGLSRPRAGGTRQALAALVIAQRSCISERTSCSTSSSHCTPRRLSRYASGSVRATAGSSPRVWSRCGLAATRLRASGSAASTRDLSPCP